MNEPAHLTAGLSYWTFGRFELYRVNPPLTRMVAALPVLALDCTTDWNTFFESPGARPAFQLGRTFLTVNGERSLWLITVARWACTPFSVLGGYMCFRWARDLYGESAALLTLTLWCFSPNIIGHGQLITPDAGAAAFGVMAGYFFWKWLRHPDWTWATVAGIALGLAQLTKMSWIALYGLWPLLWLLTRRGTSRDSQTPASFWRESGQLAVILCLSLYVLNLGYGFEGSFQTLKTFDFVSESLRAGHNSDTGDPDAGGNRFAETWLANIPVPLPRNYLLGMDLQKRDFEDFGRPSYLRGHLRDTGWWYYYLYALCIKVPIGTWLLFLGACFTPLLLQPRTRHWRDVLVLLAPAVVILAFVSSQTGFSRHSRYVLSSFPFVFIWLGQCDTFLTSPRRGIRSLACGALLWSIGSSLWIYPHSLSYFNELTGGPLGGPKHLIDSNIDWGQDLLYLKRWVEDHPQARPLHLAFYGDYDPSALNVDFTLPPRKPPDHKHAAHWDSAPIEPGWYAISATLLQGYWCRIPQGNGAWRSLKRDSFAYMRQLTPTATAGYSIYIFRISQHDADRVNQRLR